MGKSGQSMCDVTPKLINMLNTYDFVNPGFTKSHTSLDNIVSLENGITYEIVYDCTIMQLQTKDLGKAGITKIAYDYTIPKLRARCMVKLT